MEQAAGPKQRGTSGKELKTFLQTMNHNLELMTLPIHTTILCGGAWFYIEGKNNVWPSDADVEPQAGGLRSQHGAADEEDVFTVAALFHYCCSDYELQTVHRRQVK